VLEGYGPLTLDSGCKTIDPDPRPYIWVVPSHISAPQCDSLCGEMQGCYDARIANSTAETSSDDLQCDLVFSRAWPQPLVQDNSMLDSSGTIRAGAIWTIDGKLGDSSDIWYYTSDDGGLLGSQTNVLFANGRGPVLAPDAEPNLELMWKFDGRSKRWVAMTSSLTNRPSPRVGAGRWSDSTGSLYMLAGLSNQNPLTVRGTVPFSVRDPNYDGSVATASVFAELWRYDTDRAIWQALHPSATDATHVAATRWPSARGGTTVWRDRGTLLTDSRIGVWMFGGWRSLSGTHEPSRTSSELWHYAYSPGNHTPGSWTLVTAQVGGADEIKPLYTCSSINVADCPVGRQFAASWPSPNGAPGKSSPPFA
jgi:hypothetical protein